MASIAATQKAGGGMMKWAVGGWLFFIAENAVLSENRTLLIDYLGDDAYHAVYGTCSTAAMASILYSYRKLRQNAVSTAAVTAIPPLRLATAAATMSLGLILASQAAPKLQVPVEVATSGTDATTTASRSVETINIKVRCPFDFTDKHQHSSTDTVTGLDRVSRHPGLWAFGLTCAGNAALQTASLPLTVWMLGPAAVAWLGGAHTDSRYRRGLGGTLDPQYASLTSNVPFAAMLSGRQGPDALATWMTEEVKPLNALVATAVACLYVASRGRGAAASSKQIVNAKRRVV